MRAYKLQYGLYNPVTNCWIYSTLVIQRTRGELDSNRIKLFLSFCLLHFYGDQNKDMREESEAQSKISSSSTFWLHQNSSCCMKQIKRKKLDILQQYKCNCISIPQILTWKNNSLTLTFLGDVSYIKVLSHWLLVMYLFCEWREFQYSGWHLWKH